MTSAAQLFAFKKNKEMIGGWDGSPHSESRVYQYLGKGSDWTVGRWTGALDMGRLTRDRTLFSTAMC